MSENTEPAVANDNRSIWAPTWLWTVGVVAGVHVFLFLLAGFGADPNELLGAIVSGGMAGAIGALLGLLVANFVSQRFEWARSRRTFVTICLVALGIGLLNLFEGVVAAGLIAVMPQEFLGRAGFGAMIGALCGLLPQLVIKPRYSRFGNVGYWVSVGLGAVAGLLLALPSAIILTIIGVKMRKQPSPPADGRSST